MKKPYDRYVKSTTKLAAVKTVKVYIEKAKKAQKDTNAAIKKSKLTKTAKAAKINQIKSYDKYITRAKNYVKGYRSCKRSNKLKLFMLNFKKQLKLKM